MTSAGRDDAIDATRAIAILGMFVIHAVLVLARQVPTQGVAALVLWWCDGRAAATFVTLAGIGVARLATRYPGVTGDVMLRRRAAALAVLGVLNHAVWPGDILRVYGVALALAPWLLRRTPGRRVALAIALALLFPALMTVIDWTEHWQLDTLTYVGAWTPSGFVRNLLYDGFRPVIPWLSFFLFGTVLAEQPLRDARVWTRLLLVGGALTAGAVLLSAWLDGVVQQAMPSLDALTREGLIGTTSLPPLPLFLLSAVGTTCLVLGAMLALTSRLPTPLVAALVATGRRALTWYVLHIVALVIALSAGARAVLTSTTAIGVGVTAFVGAIAWSWRHRHTTGWLEQQLRALTQPRVATAVEPAR